MTSPQSRRVMAFVVLAALAALVLLCATGCFGPLLGFKKPDAAADEPATPPAKAEAEEQEAKFPLAVFIGWLIPGGALCVAAFLFGMKPLVPIVGGAGIVLATAMAVQLKLTEILFGLLCLSVLSVIVLGFMWFRRSRMFADLVGGLESVRETSPKFKAAMSKRLKVKKATSAMVDKVKKKGTK